MSDNPVCSVCDKIVTVGSVDAHGNYECLHHGVDRFLKQLDDAINELKRVTI